MTTAGGDVPGDASGSPGHPPNPATESDDKDATRPRQPKTVKPAGWCEPSPTGWSVTLLHTLGGPPRRLRRHPSPEGNFPWLRRCTRLGDHPVGSADTPPQRGIFRGFGAAHAWETTPSAPPTPLPRGEFSVAPALHTLGGPPRRLRRHPSPEGNSLRRLCRRPSSGASRTTPAPPTPFPGGIFDLTIESWRRVFRAISAGRLRCHTT